MTDLSTGQMMQCTWRGGLQMGVVALLLHRIQCLIHDPPAGYIPRGMSIVAAPVRLLAGS